MTTRIDGRFSDRPLRGAVEPLPDRSREALDFGAFEQTVVESGLQFLPVTSGGMAPGQGGDAEAQPGWQTGQKVTCFRASFHWARSRKVLVQEKRNPDFANNLCRWLERAVTVFGDRILEFDAQDGLVWGELSAWIGHSDAGLMIAAQLIALNMVVVTGNGEDCEPTGAHIVDPF